jgi:hypothetical protein
MSIPGPAPQRRTASAEIVLEHDRSIYRICAPAWILYHVPVPQNRAVAVIAVAQNSVAARAVWRPVVRRHES